MHVQQSVKVCLSLFMISFGDRGILSQANIALVIVSLMHLLLMIPPWIGVGISSLPHSARAMATETGLSSLQSGRRRSALPKAFHASQYPGCGRGVTPLDLWRLIHGRTVAASVPWFLLPRRGSSGVICTASQWHSVANCC